MFLRLKAQSCEAKTAAGSFFYFLCRSPRRKTLTIYVKEDRSIRVLSPLFLNNQKIESFIQRKASWILKSLKKQESRQLERKKRFYKDGETFLFLGQSYPLCYVPSEGQRTRIHFAGSRFEALVPLHMPCDRIEGYVKKAFFVWYKNQAKKIIEERLLVWRQKLDIQDEKVVVRSQKRIWGSSYYKTKRININWKVVMTPLYVIDYVIVHELCHFFVPNHSQRFWDKVKNVFPGYQDSEHWLKEHEALTRLS